MDVLIRKARKNTADGLKKTVGFQVIQKKWHLRNNYSEDSNSMDKKYCRTRKANHAFLNVENAEYAEKKGCATRIAIRDHRKSEIFWELRCNRNITVSFSFALLAQEDKLTKFCGK